MEDEKEENKELKLDIKQKSENVVKEKGYTTIDLVGGQCRLNDLIFNQNLHNRLAF